MDIIALIILAWIALSFLWLALNGLLAKEVSTDIVALRLEAQVMPHVKPNGKLLHAWANARRATVGLVSSTAFLLLGIVSFVRFVQEEPVDTLRWVAIGALFFALLSFIYSSYRDYILVKRFVSYHPEQ